MYHLCCTHRFWIVIIMCQCTSCVHSLLKEQKTAIRGGMYICAKERWCAAGKPDFFPLLGISNVDSDAHLLHHHDLLLLFQKVTFLNERTFIWVFVSLCECVYVLLGITHSKSVNDNLCGLEDTFLYPPVIYFCCLLRSLKRRVCSTVHSTLLLLICCVTLLPKVAIFTFRFFSSKEFSFYFEKVTSFERKTDLLTKRCCKAI